MKPAPELRRIGAVSADREAREARAAHRAATLPSGDYYADGSYVTLREPGLLDRAMIKCETHWDACLVLLATGRK